MITIFPVTVYVTPTHQTLRQDKNPSHLLTMALKGTKALLVWSQRCTESYKEVKIENMTKSWRDGLAFCAIIHHYRPDLM